MRKKRTIGPGLIALLMETVLIFLTGMQSGPGHMGRGKQSRIDNFDRHFIEEHDSHHEEAVRVADLALRKAEHRRLKRLAADIKRTQTKEIKDMSDGMGREATDFKELTLSKKVPVFKFGKRIDELMNFGKPIAVADDLS